MTTLERREEYDRALEINPDDKSVPVFMAEGKDALRMIEKWVEKNPTNAQAAFELGCAYRGQRRYLEAAAALARAVELGQGNVRYRDMLQKILDESSATGRVIPAEGLSPADSPG
jgi:cytochrome c-type biogenesis protein CcmH/NrfG